MPEPPFFVIRNSIHSSPGKDEAAVAEFAELDKGVGEKESECGASKDKPKDDADRTNASLPIVRLVEAPRGMYALDFDRDDDSFLAGFLAENQMRGIEAVSSDGRSYVDGRAWRHLEAYGLLVGAPVARGDGDATERDLCLNSGLDKHEGSFVLLEDAVKDAIHTLLPIVRLFSWETLVEARGRGELQWTDIRTFLKQVRDGVPFLTHDGVLKRVVNTHLTFHQFVAFSRLVESHLEMIVASPPVAVPDVKIYDIFPSFDSMSPEEQRIELLASIKDKASRGAAQTAGLTVPISADRLVSAVEYDEEWRAYIHWWSASDDIRNDFCMREILFAEGNGEVRRSAEKDGVSMRGRHSKDASTRERFLRRFGTWYLGIEDSVVTDEGVVEKVRPSSKCPAGLHTYDFATGTSSRRPIDTPSRASPPKMPDFRNTSWKPSSATEEDEELADAQGEVDDSFSLDRFLVTSVVDTAECNSRPSSMATVEAPIVLNLPVEEERPQKQDRAAPINNETHEKTSGEDDVRPQIIGSKTKSKEKSSSFRRQFLRRLTSDIDDVTSMVNEKRGSNLRGIKLFRSKVRLIIMLQKFPLWKSAEQLEATAPQNVDIFRFEAQTPPVAKPEKPESPKRARPDSRVHRELMETAKAHHQRALCRKGFNAISDWKQRMLVKRQERLAKEQRGKEQRMREEEQRKLLNKKSQRMRARVMASRLKKCIEILRDHAVWQKNERLKEVPPVPEVKEEEPVKVETDVEEEFTYAMRSTDDEKRGFAAEDKRSLAFRNYRRKFALDSPALLEELDCMELIVGRRNRRSGLDVVRRDEYDQHFAKAVELKVPSPLFQSSPIKLLDKATLRKMKKEKVAGASNLFDVPQEFIYPPLSSPGDRCDVEYRTREKVKGLVKQNS